MDEKALLFMLGLCAFQGLSLEASGLQLRGRGIPRKSIRSPIAVNTIAA